MNDYEARLNKIVDRMLEVSATQTEITPEQRKGFIKWLPNYLNSGGSINIPAGHRFSNPLTQEDLSLLENSLIVVPYPEA